MQKYKIQGGNIVGKYMEYDYAKSIITKQYKDETTGVPVTKLTTETQTVNSLKNIIQLIGEPDKLNRVTLVDQAEMIEVENYSDLTTSNQYYVDYPNAVVYFHPDKKAQQYQIEYGSRGLTLIGYGRVFTKLDANGNVLETLEDLITNATESMRLVKLLGDANIIIAEFQENVDSAKVLNPSLIVQNASATTNIASLTSKNSTATTNIASLTTQNTNATPNITNLTTQNTTASSNITSLTTQNNTAGTNITNLTTQNTSASTNIPSLTTQNTNASANITSLNTKNATATTNISSLTTQNTSASSNIPSLTSLNTFSDGKIAELVTATNEADERIATMQSYDVEGVVATLATKTGFTYQSIDNAYPPEILSDLKFKDLYTVDNQYCAFAETGINSGDVMDGVNYRGVALWKKEALSNNYTGYYPYTSYKCVNVNNSATYNDTATGAVPPLALSDILVTDDIGITSLKGHGSTGTVGSMDILGNKGLYSGFNFKDYSRSFVANATVQGVTDSTGGLIWAWTSGALTTGTVPWARLTGVPTATTTVSGLMPFADKLKLDGVATSANNYAHPATHPPSIIVQDTTNRFATDAEKTIWNAKAPTTAVTTTVNGLMAFADKVKLDGVATGATNYTHPANHVATVITQDATHRFVTDTEKASYALGGVVETYRNADNLTFYVKYPNGLLIIGGGLASFPNVGGTIIDLTITLPLTVPIISMKFYTSIYPADPINAANWTSTAPEMYQKTSTTARLLVYGGLTTSIGYSISWYGVGFWQ